MLATIVVFSIMVIVWHWKTYEVVERPGWWILIPVLAGIIGYALIFLGVITSPALSVIGFILLIAGGIVHLVLIGIVAWGGEKSSDLPQVQINKKAK